MLLLALARCPSLTRCDYQVLAGVSEATALHDIAELMASGHIKRLGEARATRYCLAGARPGTTPESI